MTDGTHKKKHLRGRLLHVLWIVPLTLLLLQNLLLWTPIARWAMNQVPVVHLKYGFAYSIVPGSLTLFNAQMVVSDRAVQMQIDAERVDLVIDLAALRSKVLHMTRAHGEGVRIRFRPVLTPEQAQAPWVALCPPIEGEPMPPVWRHPERPKPPTEKLIKFHFENMDVQLEEVWLGPVRLEGKGHVTGGFLLHPRTRVGIFPAQLRFDRGTRASLGEVVFSDDMALALTGSLAVTDFAKRATAADSPAAAKSSKPPPLLAALRAHVEIDGPFKSLAAVQPLLPAHQLRVTSGAGQLALQAGVEQGQLAPGFSFKLDSGRVRLTAPQVEPPLTLAGPFAVRLNAQDGQHVAARMDWSHVQLSYVKDKSPTSGPKSPQLKHLQVNGKFTLGRGLFSPHFDGGRALIEELELPQLDFFAPLLEGTPLKIRRGRGVVNAEVDIPKDLAARGHVEAKVHEMLLQTDDVQLDFSAGLEGQLSVHPKTGRLSIQPVTLIAQPLYVQLGEHRVPWQFRLTTGHTSIDMETGNKVSDVALHGPSVQPFLDVLIKNGLLRTVSKAIVARGDTEARLRFTQSKVTTRLDLVSVKSGRLAIDGVLMTDEKQLRGAFLLIGSVVRVGIAWPEGKVQVHPTASRRWLENELKRQGILKVQHERVKGGHQDKAKATR